MTGDINAQVEHVVALINEMVSLTAESVTHAQTSSADLDELVKTETKLVVDNVRDIRAVCSQ